MKTLLITGVYKMSFNDKGYFDGVKYDIDLFGQTEDDPKMVYIKSIVYNNCSGYCELMELVTLEYCRYYNTSAFNIIHLDMLKDVDNLKDF